MTIPNSSSRESPGTSSRIREAIDECARRRASGEELSDEWLTAAYPELMPRLAEELRKPLQNAAERCSAKQPLDAEESESIQEGCLENRYLDSLATISFDDSPTTPGIGSHTAPFFGGDAQAPSKIGPYQILKILGEGGYGIVYLARDIELDRPVAIKVAKQRSTDPNPNVNTFLDEARRVAQLGHPSIINILDVSRGDSSAWYLVMEYVAGPSLSGVFCDGSLSMVALVRLLVQIADGVEHAHAHGILHRDLKPANILLGKDGRPRIVDFGMALQEREQYLLPKHVAGTPYCMSPEQVRGETHRLDARTDLWGLGVIMYEGLTGQRPFTAESISRVFETILAEDPAPPADLNPSVPEELERICLKCLAKRMADRYNTVAEFSADLQRWLDGPGSSRPVTAASLDTARGSDPVGSEVRMVPRGLRSFGAEDAGFFLDLLPGPRDRNGLPESVHFWTTSIENAEQSSERAVLVLYGPSGTGKSSFVKAGILPRLGPGILPVIVDAAAGNVETDLLSKLHAVRPTLPARVQLAQACAQIRRDGAGQSQAKVLIVLDQFEQWLHMSAGDLSGELTDALRHCDGKQLQCLIIVRSDFWVGITRFMRSLEVPLVEGRNSSHLDLFDLRHARKILTLFGRSYGCLPPAVEPLSDRQTTFVEQAVQQIATDHWVVPVRLALFAEMMKGREWDIETLSKLGGERGIGVAYLEQVFSSPLAAPSHRRYRAAAEAALRALLPEAGVELKGRCLTRYQLKQASGLADKPERFAELIDILDSQLRLITPTESLALRQAAAPEFGSSIQISTAQPSFQLTHDYLVPSLREWLTREQQASRKGRVQLLLEERDAQWRRESTSRYLPTFIENARICAWTSRRDWTTSQAAMMRKGIQLHLRRAVLRTLTVLLVAGAIYLVMPPDPLPVFLNPNRSAADRISAFDRLDLSSVNALGPALSTLKREQNAEVLSHAIDRLSDYVKDMHARRATADDSVQGLVLSVTRELLTREQIADDEIGGFVRMRLFSIYTTLASPADVLHLVTEDVNRHRLIPVDALLEFLQSLGERDVLSNNGEGQSETRHTEKDVVLSLVKLMDTLPEAGERNAAAAILAQLPTEQLVELFMRSFVGESLPPAARSAQVYITALPVEQRASQVARLSNEFTDRLDLLIKEQPKSNSTSDQLEYVLTSIIDLQPFLEFRQDKAFHDVSNLLEYGEKYREGSVLDVACAAYAALARIASKNDVTDQSVVVPLREVLIDSHEDENIRCAAAEALGSLENDAAVGDLAKIALTPHESIRLRETALQGLASLGRRQFANGENTGEVADVFVKLLDTKTYMSDPMLDDVVKEFATFGQRDQLPYFLSLMSRRDDNLVGERAVYVYLMRYPEDAQQIAEQSLVAVAHLTADQKATLFPGPEGFLADIAQVQSFYDRDTFRTACCRLATGLANTSALHADEDVRRLASQNLRQLIALVPLPAIDPDATEANRKRQLESWRNAWSAVEAKLIIGESIQLEVGQ